MVDHSGSTPYFRNFSKNGGKYFWIALKSFTSCPAFAGMTIQNNLLIIIVIPAKAGIQVHPILNLIPPLFEKLPGFFNFMVDRALTQPWGILSSGIFICQTFFSFSESYLFNESLFENF